MNMFAIWVVVGLLAGWLASVVVKAGGHGLSGDLILGLVGSIAASVIFQGLEISPGAGMSVLVVVAFVGAAMAIVAQRKFWHAAA